MNALRLGMCVAALTLSCSALAAPIVNGNVLGADGYAAVFNDAIGEPSLAGPDLDIATLQTYFDSTDRYFGVTVAQSPIAQFGGPTSFMGSTGLSFLIKNQSNVPVYTLLLSTGAMQYARLLEFNGTIWVNKPLLPADVSVAWGEGLEFRLAKSVTPNLIGNNFNVQMQLDDTGMATDDQFTVAVPEPTTLALLGLGAVAMIRRWRA